MFKKLFGSKSEKETTEQVEKMDLITNDKDYYTISSEVIGKVLELAKSSLEGSKLHTGNIPEKKLSNVVNIYGVDESRIIALYDTTVFKSGKDGILLCDYFIGLKHAFGSAMVVEFQDLVMAEISETEKSLQINGRNIDIGSKKFTEFFEQLKELLISDDSYLRSKYEDYVLIELNEIKLKIDNNHYDAAENRFLSLEKIVISNNKEYCASLYYYGCLIRMEQLNFVEAYSYFSSLEQLQQWESNKIIELKQTIDQRKAQHEFNLLEEQKDAFIQENQYDRAINIVKQQKTLHIKSSEQLVQEINRIQSIKEEYIQLLEAKAAEKLECEVFEDVLTILEELNQINPNVSYDEYYVRAKIGTYAFEEVEQQINSIKEVDQQLAEKLEQYLQAAKKNVSGIILNAVSSKDYSFFREHSDLKNIKDSWGMTPLMHFIIHKDLAGIELLADTFDPSDRNAIGHTSLNLANLDYENVFCRDALRLLDDKLIQMMKKYKSKSKLNKIGKVALKGLDSLNSKALLSFELAEATSNAETNMSSALEELEREIKSYEISLITDNYKEFVKYIRKPKNYSEEYTKLAEKKRNIENELEKLQEKKSHLENSIGVKLEEAKNTNLYDFLFEAAGIELGEKDEFETSSEYENRKRAKAEEIKLTYLENDYVKEQLKRLEEEVETALSDELKEIEGAIGSTAIELKSMESNINEHYYLLNCQSKLNTNEILDYYYHTYQSKLETGPYDADLESFNMVVSGEEKAVRVPRKVAKEFKTQLSSLKPAYKMELVRDEDKEKIQHNFVYDFEGEQITIPFMLSLTK